MKHVNITKTHTVYVVVDHEDNHRRYNFESEAGARQWKDELVECFDTNPENVTVMRQEWNVYGHLVSQHHI